MKTRPKIKKVRSDYITIKRATVLWFDHSIAVLNSKEGGVSISVFERTGASSHLWESSKQSAIKSCLAHEKEHKARHKRKRDIQAVLRTLADAL